MKQRKFVALSSNEYWDEGDIITAYERVEMSFQGCVSDIEISSCDAIDNIQHALFQVERMLEKAYRNESDYGYMPGTVNGSKDMVHEYMIMMMNKALESMVKGMNFTGVVKMPRLNRNLDVLPIRRESHGELKQYPKSDDVNPFRIVSGNDIFSLNDRIGYLGSYKLIPLEKDFIDIIEKIKLSYIDKKEYELAAKYRKAHMKLGEQKQK